MLFLRGSLNELMPPEHQQTLAGFYPNSEIITVEEAGHDVLTAKYDTCIKIVINYLNEVK